MASSEKRTPKRWTDGEDTVLQNEVLKQSSSRASSVMDWNKVAASLPGRTNKDCRKRWVNRLCGERKMGPWDREEDKLLLEAMGNYGPRWTVIAGHVGSRSPDQCAKRWQFKLDPKLNRGRWSATEDQLLLKCVGEYGREWKRIQDDHYPGRSRNDLKNRHTILTRRSNTESRARAASDPAHVVDIMAEEDSPQAESSSTDNNEALELGGGSVIGGDDGDLGMQLGDGEADFGFGMDMDGCGDHWLDAVCRPPGSMDFTDIAIDFNMLQGSSSAVGLSPPAATACLSASQSPGVASVVSVEDLDLQMAQFGQQHDLDAASLFRSPLFPPPRVQTRPRVTSRALSEADTGLGDVLGPPPPPVRRSKVALVVEACDGLMLNRLLAVARMADGKAKVEIEYVT